MSPLRQALALDQQKHSWRLRMLAASATLVIAMSAYLLAPDDRLWPPILLLAIAVHLTALAFLYFTLRAGRAWDRAFQDQHDHLSKLS